MKYLHTGWGPFRLPGEKRRMRKAEEEARRLWAYVNGLRDPNQHEQDFRA
jgi:hypothetical protein